jgi:HSP20 family protein
MDAQDEKFFESLAGAKSEADQDYEVEFAKADGATMARTVRPARAAKIEPKETSKDWSDNEPEGQLTVDVYQTSADIVIESAIAGVKPEDIDVNVTPDSISIRGSRHREKHAEGEDYLYQECYWGRFARSIILPQEIDPENADVTFKNGILTVRLPKANKKKSRKLHVKSE